MPDQVRALHHVGRHHPVGLGHDAGLLVEAQRGLELGRALGHRVLEPAEGVEHLHERGAPLLPEPQAGHPGEPVVRVDHVVGDAALPREVLDAGRELVEVGMNRLAGHRRLGARGQVHHAGAGTELDHPGDRRVLRPGEDVDVEPHAPELARDLPHVDVHPAGLLAAQGGEGTGVHREHRHRKVHGVTFTLSTSSGEGPKLYL